MSRAFAAKSDANDAGHNELLRALAEIHIDGTDGLSIKDLLDKINLVSDVSARLDALEAGSLANLTDTVDDLGTRLSTVEETVVTLQSALALTGQIVGENIEFDATAEWFQEDTLWLGDNRYSDKLQLAFDANSDLGWNVGFDSHLLLRRQKPDKMFEFLHFTISDGNVQVRTASTIMDKNEIDLIPDGYNSYAVSIIGINGSLNFAKVLANGKPIGKMLTVIDSSSTNLRLLFAHLDMLVHIGSM